MLYGRTAPFFPAYQRTFPSKQIDGAAARGSALPRQMAQRARLRSTGAHEPRGYNSWRIKENQCPGHRRVIPVREVCRGRTKTDAFERGTKSVERRTFHRRGFHEGGTKEREKTVHPRNRSYGRVAFTERYRIFRTSDRPYFVIMILENTSVCRRLGKRSRSVRSTNVQRELRAIYRIRVCNPD